MVNVRGASYLKYGYNVAHDRAMIRVDDADNPNSSFMLWMGQDGYLLLDVEVDGKTTTYRFVSK